MAKIPTSTPWFSHCQLPLTHHLSRCRHGNARPSISLPLYHFQIGNCPQSHGTRHVGIPQPCCFSLRVPPELLRWLPPCSSQGRLQNEAPQTASLKQQRFTFSRSGGRKSQTKVPSDSSLLGLSPGPHMDFSLCASASKFCLRSTPVLVA